MYGTRIKIQLRRDENLRTPDQHGPMTELPDVRPHSISPGICFFIVCKTDGVSLSRTLRLADIHRLPLAKVVMRVYCIVNIGK